MILFMLLAATTETPRATLEKATTEVRTIVAEKAAIDTKQKKMRAITARLVNFDTIAEQTLGAEWAKMTPKQRKEFATTLQQLVEASYLNKVSEASTVDITYTGAEGSTVDATAKAQGSDVHLKFTVTDAQIRDVEIDDVSLVRNYRSQFAKVIAKSGVKELQAKIQKKVNELRANDATPTAATAP